MLGYSCTRGNPEDAYARGRGLRAAAIPPSAESQVINAAIRASFDVVPGLNLRLHPRHLPRTAGDSGGTPVSPQLLRLVRDEGLVTGTCEPRRSAPRDTPRCSGPDAGYVIRTSDVLRIAADTLEIYLSAETYGAATGRRPDALRFEKVYELVERGGGWRVVREGRVKD